MGREETQIEAVPEALWRHRAHDPLLNWDDGWEKFSTVRPDLANIYRDNARVAVKAIAELSPARKESALPKG